MSSIRRLVAGNAATTARILVMSLGQIVLVPVFLSHWDTIRYGVWIGIFAYVGLLSTLDFAFHDYLEGECLKNGPDARQIIRSLLWSALPVAVLLGVAELFVTCGLVELGLPHRLFALHGSPQLLHEAGSCLILVTLQSSLTQSCTGPLVRATYPFGYYASMTWWDLGIFAAGLAAPPLVAMRGGGLILASAAYCIVTTLLTLIRVFVMLTLLRKEELAPQKPIWRTGFTALGRSQALSVRVLAEQARTQGSRLVVVPLLGPTGLLAFTTMRTFANVLVQALTTFTSPVKPEMMRFIVRREQEKMALTLKLLWFACVSVAAPIALFLQVIGEAMFHVWTHGKIVFDPVFFSLVTGTACVFGLAQPATSVLRGNNLLRPQLLWAIVSFILTIGSLAILVPQFGLRGAAIGLLVTEIVVLCGHVRVARKWLETVELDWPTKSFQLSCLAVAFVCLGTLTMAIKPGSKVVVLCCLTPFLAFIIYMFWRDLPHVVKHKLRLMRSSRTA